MFGVNSKQAFDFFLRYLCEEVVSKNVSEMETLYVASVMAHYAQTSRHEAMSMSPSGSLYDILDTFVLPGFTAEGAAGLQDPEILEVAGSHTLLLVGFFRDQMKRQHNLGWYVRLGQSFFDRAGSRLKAEKKAGLLRSVALNFPLWATACSNMSRTLREERFLLKFES